MSSEEINIRSSELSEPKRALLEKLLRGKSSGGVTAPLIPRRSDRTSSPLSYSQRPLWFLDRLFPGNPAYLIRGAVRLCGALDPDALLRSINVVVKRHESLRTYFIEVDGSPAQAVSPEMELDLPVSIVDYPDERRRLVELQRLALDEAIRPFDLTRLPLMRARLVRLGPEEHVLLLVMHHIISDEWSIALLLQEVSQLYSSSIAGEERSLRELQIQYADYAVWQNECIKNGVHLQQLGYWKERLAGSAVLNLPADRRRPAAPTFRGGRQPVHVSAALTAALKTIGEKEQATLFMTLTAVFKTLLARLAAEEDIAIATPIANRNRKEVRSLIGCFINTVVLRTDLSGDPSVREVVRRVKETATAAYENQEVPFELLVEEIHPGRSMSRNPLTDIIFSFQSVPLSFSEMGLPAETADIDNQSAKVDLVLSLQEKNGGLDGYFEFSSDLFESATIERMAARFASLIKQTAANPEQRISQLSLFVDQERSVVLEWGDAEKGFETVQSLHQLFEEQARRSPSSTALIDEENQVTYHELNQRADLLAARLRSFGFGPESRIGILLDRSVETLTAILGVLKSGAAYVPIDPAYPEERLRFILNDAGCAGVITGISVMHRLADFAGVIIKVEELSGSVQSRPLQDEFEGAVQPDNAAYVIYTSGSTGRPKGVIVTHADVVRLLRSTEELYSFSAGDVWTLFHSFAFDFSIWEIWGALAYGGRLVVPPYIVTRSPESFYDLVAREQVTVLNQTPSAFQQFAAVDEKEGGRRSLALRAVILGGEALDPIILQRWIARRGDERPRLVNMYGITETTVHVTHRRMLAADAERGAGSVIGRRLADLQLRVLDRNLEPAPIGIPGEIYVGGDGLARGYLNRPELTAERFVPDPFQRDEDARLYRSGDRARFLANGDLEYLGRADNQVKVRGFRIEPGEIESALVSLPGIREAVAVHYQGDRLLAYVVEREGAGINSETLRSELLRKLPEYMVPSGFVFVDAIPMTANGKVDRRRLLEIEPDRTENSLRSAVVSGPVEELVAQTWAEILGGDQGSAGENFFSAGGHSLSAVQLVSRVNERLGVDVPVRALFESPTLREFARTVETELTERAGVRPSAIRRVDRSAKLRLSFAQQRLWFLDQLQPGSAFYNVPIAIRMKGSLDQEMLERSLNQVIRRHEVLRTGFRLEEGEPVQVIEETASLRMELIDLRVNPEAQDAILCHACTAPVAEIERLEKEEAARPFDFLQPPLMRAKLIRISEDEWELVLTVHHIVFDGWSIGVLMKEVGALYSAGVDGTAGALPELDVQYADYAAWQREWLAGGVLEQQLSYWRRQLAGDNSPLELPLDRPRPEIQTYNGARVPMTLSADLSRALKELSNRHGVTLFMALVAVFKVLLYRYTGREEVRVGTPVAGRFRSETEALIGLFVNTIVLKTELSGSERFSDLLDRIRKVALEGYAHQAVPFEKLVDEFENQRNLSYTPLFQVIFTLQNGIQDELVLPNLETASREIEMGVSKFDLIFALREAQEQLSGCAEYNTSLFDRSTIELMIEHFFNLAASAARNPESAVNSMAMLGETERAAILDEGRRKTSYRVANCLHQLFEQQAECNRDNMAVVFEDQRLSYADLNRRANQLARFLIRNGVALEDRVAICTERSAEMIVAILGVVKAGAAYVPIETTYPKQRVDYIFDNADLRAVVTYGAPVEELRAFGVRVIDLEADWSEIAGESVENLSTAVGPENAAYALYTSGSTGTPKGVIVTHANIARMLRASRVWLDFSDRDAWTLFHSYGFDISVWEFWGALAHGATLVVPSYQVSRSPEAFWELLIQEQVTIVNQTPSAFRQIVKFYESGTNVEPPLRFVILGGEAIDLHTLSPWVERNGRQRPLLVNIYGITETSMYNCYRQILQSEVREGGTARMGRAIPDNDLFVVDSGLELIPRGMVGELVIGGDAVSRGYLNRAELTAVRFVPDPFSDGCGARMYRSGDLVRRAAKDDLEFRGRIDHQVKVRGFRIELGEIESALMAHPGVRECAVIIRPSGNDQMLVAYVVTKDRTELTASELREHMRERLPDYMVPGVFVMMESLPVSASGKIDRLSLPEPDSARPSLEVSYVEPKSDAEMVLAVIWKELFKLERVGVNDNFFDLGGNSMLMIEARAKVIDAFKTDVSMVQMFKYASISSLARFLALSGETTAAVIAPAPEQIEKRRESMKSRGLLRKQHRTRTEG